MTLDKAIELLTDGSSMCDALIRTGAQDAAPILAGRRVLDGLVMRHGSIQTAVMSDPDRAAVIEAALLVERSLSLAGSGAI